MAPEVNCALMGKGVCVCMDGTSGDAKKKERREMVQEQVKTARKEMRCVPALARVLSTMKNKVKNAFRGLLKKKKKKKHVTEGTTLSSRSPH